MSISLPKNNDFIRKCKSIAEKYDASASFDGSVLCYYDASPYSKRDYCLEFTTNYTSVPYMLTDELKKAGAVKIIGKVRKAIARKYVDIAFNMKTSTAEFKSYDDLSYHLRHYGSSPESLLYDWFEHKIKIVIAGKNVSYTDVIHNCLKDKMQVLYIKNILEEESEKQNKKQKNLKEKSEEVWLPPKLRTDPKRPWASNFFGDDPFLRHEDEPDSVLDKEEYNKAMELHEGKLEDEQMFGRSKKALEIIDAMDSNIEILEALHDEFVPDSGIADTIGGEVVRAINRIVYRWNNDGDEIGWDYGVETVNSSYQYLIENNIIVDNYRESDFDGNYQHDRDKYDAFLDKLMKQIIDTLYNRPELFDEKNEDDSRDGYKYYVENESYDEEDYDDDYYDDEEEEEEDEDYEE